jgi:hypothetical protein
MNRLNYCVNHHNHNNRDGIHSLLAPYSRLAELADGLEFYRHIRKEKEVAEFELLQAAKEVAEEINSVRETIISIADPYANPNALSEKDIHQFAIPYLAVALSKITTKKTVHICPYSSIFLVKFGFAQEKSVTISPQPYYDVLLQYAQNRQFTLLGHQCIHTEMAVKAVTLHMLGGGSRDR